MKFIKWFYLTIFVKLTGILFILQLHTIHSEKVASLSSFKITSFKNKKHKRPNENIYSNWVKYFHYDETQKTIPKYFITNNNNNEQTINLFYITIDKDSIKFYTKKQNGNIHDILSIEHITHIPEFSHLNGGIKDLGYFSEGYCFKVETNNQINNINETWVICLNSDEEKNEMMNHLIKLKLNKQKEQVIDGYWIPINEWSACSQLCGGGIQIQHLQCIPPKNGGKPCIGSNILQRPCNTHPCSDTNNNIIIPFTPKPQRYDKCILKETYATYIDNNNDKILLHLIMNNNSITLYNTNETIITSFLLENTSLIRIKSNNKCFILKDNIHTVQICSLYNSNSFVNEWKNDFNLFKFKCKYIFQLENTITTNEDYVQKEKELKNEYILQQYMKRKLNKSNEEKAKMKNQIKEAQTKAITSLIKEQQLAEMLIKQAQEQSKNELYEMELQIQKEQKKKDSIQKVIQEKAIESKLKLSQQETEDKLRKIKEQEQFQILQNRKDVQSRIDEINKATEEKKKNLMKQIQMIKNDTGKIAEKVSKGDEMKCKNITDINDITVQQKQIQNYCNNELRISVLISECVNDFCFVCCENEFSELFLKERKSCYDNICRNKS